MKSERHEEDTKGTEERSNRPETPVTEAPNGRFPFTSLRIGRKPRKV